MRQVVVILMEGTRACFQGRAAFRLADAITYRASLHEAIAATVTGLDFIAGFPSITSARSDHG